jgi:hypothetical protein
MSTAARPITPSISLTEIMLENATETIATLRRDLKAARVRNGTFIRAQNGYDATPVATLAETASVAALIRWARMLEDDGKIPLLRFARGADGEVCGVEVAVVKDTTPVAPRAEAGEMAVVGEPMERAS